MAGKKIGLALSGGGARGFSHVGAIKVLADNGIHFDMIAGTSAGSIVGAALASGMSPAEIDSLARRMGWLNTLRPSFSFGGLISLAPLGEMLRKVLPVSHFEELQVPFAAVAFDLVKSKEVILTGTGDLITAIRASCAVPGVFAPIPLDDMLLVDGGVTSVLPVDVVRAMGADVVIAIDVLACGSSFKSVPRTGLGIAIRTAMTMIGSSSADQRARADHSIEPAISHIRPDQIKRADEAIRLGEEAALSMIEEIKRSLE
jgi:NTE family protein